MPQFDVYRLAEDILVVDVQSDLVSGYGTRMVIPLVSPDDDAGPVARLNPLLRVAGEQRLLATQLAAAVPRAELTQPVDTLAQQDLTIKSAIDVLVGGV